MTSSQPVLSPAIDTGDSPAMVLGGDAGAGPVSAGPTISTPNMPLCGVHT